MPRSPSSVGSSPSTAWQVRKRLPWVSIAPLGGPVVPEV